MSVAASESEPSAAVKRIPERTCTVPRVETARETTPSFATSSSFETVIFIPVASVTGSSPVSNSTSAVASLFIVLLYFSLVAVIGSVDDGEDGSERLPERVCAVGPLGGERRVTHRQERFRKVSTEISRLA